MKTTPRPGQIAILAGGAVCFIFSFFGWFSYDGDNGGSAWTSPGSNDSFGISPLTIWPALLGLIAAGALAAKLFGNVNLPDRVLGLDWKALNVVLAFPGLLIMLSVLIVDVGDLDKGFGIWLSLLGAIALFAGAIMELSADGAPSGGGGGSAAPPSPF
jgi:hypothetical protein